MREKKRFIIYPCHAWQSEEHGCMTKIESLSHFESIGHVSWRKMDLDQDVVFFIII